VHKIIYSKFWSLISAVCTEKCTTLGRTGCKGRTWKIGEESRMWLDACDLVPVHNVNILPLLMIIRSQ